MIAAGCTDLFPATPAKYLSNSVLDVTAVAEMQGIETTPMGWRIGGAVTWSDLLRADLPPLFDALKEAAREVGSIQIQNAGTIAGNLCNASPAADGAPPLLVLGAELELTSRAGTRKLPLDQFLMGPRQTALEKGEILSAIFIPKLNGASRFFKLGARRYLVISIVMGAVRLSVRDGVIEEAGLSIGACGPTALRLADQERALIGVSLPEAAAAIRPDLIEPHLAPIDDIRADAHYRRGSATVLLRRGLCDLTDRMAR